MYSKFVAKLSENQNEMRNRMRTILITNEGSFREIAKEIKISHNTLMKFVKGATVYPRTAWRIASYIEIEMQRTEFE